MRPSRVPFQRLTPYSEYQADVNDLIGGDSFVQELTERRVNLDCARSATTRVEVLDLQDRCTHVGKERHIVADRRCFVTCSGQGGGLGKCQHLVVETARAVGIGHHEVEQLPVFR
jgi:hypothetical protein